MKIAINLLLFLLVLLLVATALLYTQQRRILFPAPSDYPRAAPAGFRIVHTQTDDGLRLTAFYRPAVAGKKTILFFTAMATICRARSRRRAGPRRRGTG